VAGQALNTPEFRTKCVQEVHTYDVFILVVKVCFYA